MKIREAGEKAVVVSLPHQPWDVDCQAAGDGMTKQEFVKDCDVNVIIARCVRLQTPVPGSDVQAVFGDLSQLPDYAKISENIRVAQEAFMSLPADVRLEYDNDPAVLLSSLSDPRCRARAVELGLLAPAQPAPSSAPPAPSSAPPAPSPAAPAAVPPPAAPAA